MIANENTPALPVPPLTKLEESAVKKLQEAAAAGNIEAVKALQDLQRNNRFNELVNNMDDDEFTP